MQIRKIRKIVELYLVRTDMYQWNDLSACGEEEDGGFCCIYLEGSTRRKTKMSSTAMVEDDVELNAISKVFAEILDDVDIEM